MPGPLYPQESTPYPLDIRLCSSHSQTECNACSRKSNPGRLDSIWSLTINIDPIYRKYFTNISYFTVKENKVCCNRLDKSGSGQELVNGSCEGGNMLGSLGDYQIISMSFVLRS